MSNSNYLLSLAPFCINDEVLGSWLGMMPVAFAALYVATTFKGLSQITHGWNEVSTTHWVFLLLGFGISVIMLGIITRISKASVMNNELTMQAKINSIFASEMLPLVADQEPELPKPVKVIIDPLRENLERKMIVSV